MNVERWTFSTRRAFTLVELLAVLVIFVLLLATFVPYGLSLRESSNRTRCVANLAKINGALKTYAAANRYFYPRVKFDPAMGNRWTAFTGPDDVNPFASGSSVSANDVTASLWLLVREGLIQPDSFVCPSGDASADPLRTSSGARADAKQRGNFRSRANLGYGYATPFSSIGDYRLNDTLPSRFALLSDLPPSAEKLRLAAAAGQRFNSNPKSFKGVNSPNHGGAGQNVLYADGTVRFEWSPYCGVRRATPTDSGDMDEANDGDNIFTALAASPLVNQQPPPNEPGVAGPAIGPAYRYDTVIVPGDGWTISLRDEGQLLITQHVAAVGTRATIVATTQPMPTTAPTTRPAAEAASPGTTQP